MASRFKANAGVAVAGVASVLLATAPAASQVVGEPEFRLGAGVAKVYLDEPLFTTIEASGRVPLQGRMSLEPAARVTWGSFSEQWSFTPRVRFDSRSPRTRFYGWVGPGLQRRRERSSRFEHTYWMLDAGIGLRLAAGRRFFIAPELGGGGATLGPGYVVGWGRPPAARRIELAAFGGVTAPFYEELELSYGPVIPAPEGIDVIFQRGKIDVFNSSRGMMGLSVTWRPARARTVELRVQMIDLGMLESRSGYSAQVRLPPRGPGANPVPFTDVDLGPIKIEQRRVTAVSLNGRYRRGPLRLSGGLTYAGRTGFAIVAPIGFGGVTGVHSTGGPNLELRTATFRAEEAGGLGLRRFGINIGTGLQFPVSDRVSIVFDGRHFYFPRRPLAWAPANQGLAADTELLRRAGLPAPRLDLRTLHVTGGVSIGL